MTPSGFNAFKGKKGEKLHFSPNVLKRTRIVTRLALNLWVRYTAPCSTPEAHKRPRTVTQPSLCVCAHLQDSTSSGTAALTCFPACQTDVSLSLLPLKCHHPGAGHQFQPGNSIICLDPATCSLWFLRSSKSIHCI